jgi:hypothetical protein
MHPDNIGAQFPSYEGEGKADIGSWRNHALGERTDRPADEPGAQWDRHTALVPISSLAHFSEYDRTRQGLGHSAQTIDSIAGELREGGPQAIREPLWIKYDHKNKWGVLVEGNHRLAAAIKAGVTHLPVAITTGADLGDRKKALVGAPLHIDNRIVEHSGWMPSDVHPGNFKQFEGAR